MKERIETEPQHLLITPLRRSHMTACGLPHVEGQLHTVFLEYVDCPACMAFSADEFNAERLRRFRENDERLEAYALSHGGHTHGFYWDGEGLLTEKRSGSE